MRAALSLGASISGAWRRGGRGDLVALALVVAAGAAVRFVGLGHQSFDSGETVTAARIIHPSYIATFHAYSTIERSGPLYYTLAWGWAHLFGTSEVGLRSLSAIFGTATIVIVFALARELFSRRAALIAATLVAVSPDLVWYSQEARSYALFILLGAASLYFFVRAIRRPSDGALAGWAVCSALALSTHYFSAFAIAPEAAWLLWAARGRPRRPLIAIGAVGAVGLALLPLAIHQEGSGRPNSFTSIPVLERAASSLVKFMTGEGPATAGVWSTLPETFRVVGVIALGFGAAATLALVLRGTTGERRGAALVGGVGAFAFCVPIGLALAGLDYIEPRNLLGSLVPLLILTAAGIDVSLRALPAGRLTGAPRLAPILAPLCLSAALLAAIWLHPALQRYDWRRLGHLVAGSPTAGVILADPASGVKPLHYFLGRPLAPLKASRYPCGVRSRTLVTVSRRRPRPDPASGLRLASSQTSQGWFVDRFRAPIAVPLDGADLERFLGRHASPRVDAAEPVTPAWDERRALEASFGGSSRRARLGGGRRTSESVRASADAPAGWPPARCWLSGVGRSETASAHGRARRLGHAPAQALVRRRSA
jgi:mannosyltransferase